MKMKTNNIIKLIVWILCSFTVVLVYFLIQSFLRNRVAIEKINTFMSKYELIEIIVLYAIMFVILTIEMGILLIRVLETNFSNGMLLIESCCNDEDDLKDIKNYNKKDYNNPKYAKKRLEKTGKRILNRTKKIQGYSKIQREIVATSVGINTIVFGTVLIGGLIFCFIEQIELKNEFEDLIKYALSLTIVIICNIVMSMLTGIIFKRSEINKMMLILNQNEDEIRFLIDKALILVAIIYLPLNIHYSITIIFYLLSKNICLSFKIEDNPLKKLLVELKEYLKKIIKVESLLVDQSTVTYICLVVYALTISMCQYSFKRPDSFLTKHLFNRLVEYGYGGLSVTYIIWFLYLITFFTLYTIIYHGVLNRSQDWFLKVYIKSELDRTERKGDKHNS